MKTKIILLLSIILFFVSSAIFSNKKNVFINIKTSIEPNIINIGEEGILKIKVTPAMHVRISSSPEFVIRLNKNDSGIVFTKNFFTASELEFKTKQEGNNVFLDLAKEILIPFKIESSFPNSHKISGKIIFTAVEKKDNWSVKTFQTFSTIFKSKIEKSNSKKK